MPKTTKMIYTKRGIVPPPSLFSHPRPRNLHHTSLYRLCTDKMSSLNPASRFCFNPHSFLTSFPTLDRFSSNPFPPREIIVRPPFLTFDRLFPLPEISWISEWASFFTPPFPSLHCFFFYLISQVNFACLSFYKPA